MGARLTGSDVPIRVLLHGDAWFAPEEVTGLTTAFELALSKLELPDRRDPLAVVVAKLIIELAKGASATPRSCATAL